VYARRRDSERHTARREWLGELVEAPAPPLDQAFAFCGALRDRPNAVVVPPGERHWLLFTDLCRRVGARWP